MSIDINYALFALVGIIAYAIIRTFYNERQARRTDIDYAVGFVGRNNTPEERLKVREEARQHMEQRGFKFDYSKAEKHNQALRIKREEEREEARIRLEADYAQQKREKDWKAEVIQISAHRREVTLPIEPVERERGVTVLYPRSSSKHVPPRPPKARKRVKKRDGTMNYQLGLDVSPVHGIRNNQQSDKTMQNSYTPPPAKRQTFKEWEIEHAHELMEDDYPPNPEQAFNHALKEKDDVRRERRKQEIIERPYTVKDYKKNLTDYDELRKRLIG